MIDLIVKVEATLSGVFIGVHDGHGGAEAATFLKEHLYETMKGELTCLNSQVDIFLVT